MTNISKHLIGPVAALGALAPMPVAALDCDMWLQCCLQVVEAHREAGVTGRDLMIAQQTCHSHEGLAPAPDLQQLFCVRAWTILSEDAYQDYLAGRIGFYPESCMPDPVDLDVPVPVEPGDIPEDEAPADE